MIADAPGVVYDKDEVVEMELSDENADEIAAMIERENG
jgi:hypothetical protein